MLYFVAGAYLFSMVVIVVLILALWKVKKLTRQMVVIGTTLGLLLTIGGFFNLSLTIYGGENIGSENYAKLTKIIHAENQVIRNFKYNRNDFESFLLRYNDFEKQYLKLVGNNKENRHLVEFVKDEMSEKALEKAKFNGKVALGDVLYFEYLNREIAREVAGTELDEQKIYDRLELDTKLNVGAINAETVPGYKGQILKV